MENPSLGINNDSLAQGAKTWVFGNKLILFLKYAVPWQTARDAGLVEVGTFYTNLTKIFVSLYGWGWDRWKDKEIGEVDSAAWETITNHSNSDPATAETRRQYFAELRKV